ncbi:TAXI family TRAP transporter solute-binding subunit [Chelativorans salis]|uniref:TAXI family TRAP transporter solute-binding subunit n=1 Tax=Chelativorans salis TaxID=2978478 RepID=A0ABT2LJ50_9HYPH|nr:TAXI family TRAP transporter solute-binding subunit [Chelativorans sp. EGI FJ00035]MCT7374054.1 TAXI family TRAP transporter solute-binding subunit [Chelativorans sp. EGI FJ00035]
MRHTTRKVAGAIAAVSLSLCATAAGAETVRIETGTSAGLTTLIPQLLAKSLSNEGVDFRINADQTLTRSALSLGVGRIDAAIVPPPAFNAMSRGVGPYKDSADQAKATAAELRSLFPFAGGVFHPIVWADSGIETWEDMRGKRIFIGPPAGAANQQITTLIRLASGGFEPDKDYTPVRLGWGAAIPSFQDGQFDVLVMSSPAGGAAIEQIGLQRKIRLIGVPAEVLKTEEWAEQLEVTGETNAVIAPGTYSGQDNSDEEIAVPAYAMVFAVNRKMDDDLAYIITKTYWENIDEYKKSVAELAQLPTSEPLAGNNIPLHPGAVRYYEEEGMAIPDRLMANQ